METRFETGEGAATLIDFMPPRETHSRLVRMVVGERGRVAFHGELILRFGYGATVPWVTRVDDNSLRAIAGPDMVVMHSSVPSHGEDLKTVVDFTIGAGETASFVLSYELSHRPTPVRIDPQERLRATEDMWTTWVAKNNIEGPWDEAVVRSLITLKAPRTRRLVGNFPQAFSHLALVNSASNLSHSEKPAEQRSYHPVASKPAMPSPTA